MGDDFVIGICSTWPIDAPYPIHLGAMLQMFIENDSKSHLYGFIVNHQDYAILQDALKQYSGSDIQSHIKQMANLCKTVGHEKFTSLSANILQSFKNVLEGGEFVLDFAPLLQQSNDESNETSNQSAETSKAPITNKEFKKKRKKKKKKNA